MTPSDEAARLREVLGAVLREVEPLLEGAEPLPRGYVGKMAARIEKLIVPVLGRASNPTISP